MGEQARNVLVAVETRGTPRLIDEEGTMPPLGASTTHRRSEVYPGTDYADGMCRNIRTLHNFEPPATSDEVRAAATQYVRKIAGTTKPSAANQPVFDEAIEAVVAATSRLLDGLVTGAAPRDREVEAAKARARNALRFGSAPRRASAF